MRLIIGAVLIRFFAAVTAHRRLFLVGVLLIAVLLGVLDLLVVTVALMLMMIVLSVVATARYRPALLLVRPQARAFLTAPGPAPVFSGAGFILLGCGLLSGNIRDILDGEQWWQLDVVTSVFWVLIVALYLWLNWGSAGVRLSPGGIHDRQAYGSLFVPWEALNPEYPAVPEKNNRLSLFYQRPDLVRRRGLRATGDAITSATDANYLAAAIGVYVANPDARPMIGTETELRRLSTYLVAA